MDHDVLLNLVNKLNIFTPKQRRPMVLAHKLLEKIIRSESNLKMNDLHMIGFNVKALLNVINCDDPDQFASILNESGLDAQTLSEYLLKERTRWLSDYDFNSLKIEGELPIAVIMHNQFKSFFLTVIQHSINYSKDSSLDVLTEWLMFDQIARNALFAKNLNSIEIDYLRLAKIMDSAIEVDKEDAMLIKSKLLQYGLDSCHAALNKSAIQDDEVASLNTKINQLQDIKNDNNIIDANESDKQICSFIIDQCKSELDTNQSLSELDPVVIISIISKSSDGRKLLVSKDAQDMGNFYNKVFNVAIKKYLEVHQACVDMIEGGHAGHLKAVEESLDRHLMQPVLSIEEDTQVNGYFKHQLMYLDSLLHVITLMLSCYKVSSQPLTEAGAKCLIKILEQNGSYNWVNDMKANKTLNDNTIITNMDYVDNYYHDNLERLKRVEKVQPRVRSQSLFRQSIDDDKDNTVKRRSSIMQLFSLQS